MDVLYYHPCLTFSCPTGVSQAGVLLGQAKKNIRKLLFERIKKINNDLAVVDQATNNGSK
jgi:hypothetical protein